MNKKHGFIRVGAVVPEIKVANVTNNVDEIIKQIKLVDKEGIQVVAFPELSLTGYTCGDLFKNRTLLNNALEGLEKLVKETAKLNETVVVPTPPFAPITDKHELVSPRTSTASGLIFAIS